jgi:hypothetical protein
MYSLGLFGGKSASRLASQSVDEKAAAHSDLTMNAPHGELNSAGLERFAPREYVLIDAIDQRSVQIEKKGRLA